MSRTSFGSDNHAGAHPDVLAAVVAANTGHTPAYGDDPWTAEAVGHLRRHLGEHAEVALTVTGGSANVLGLAAVLNPWQHVVAATSAHVVVDEAGALARTAGLTLVPVPTPDGKLTPELVRSTVTGVGSPHHTQPGAVTVTQSTELGTLYTPDELGALADVAHEHGMLLHMDGARLVNAAAALGTDLADLTVDAGVDVLSLGTTKNGTLGAEAVVVLSPGVAPGLAWVRKQQGQLVSKARFVAAQVTAMFAGDLWLENARRANAAAARLAAAVRDVPGVGLTGEVLVNAVFAEVPSAAVAELTRTWPFYVWSPAGPGRDVVRWMCAWDTPDDAVDAFAADVARVVPRYL